METRNTLTRRTTRELPCKLTDDEVRTRGIDLARATSEHLAIQENKKAAAKGFKDELDTVNTRIYKLKNMVQHGVEIRDVSVECRIDAHLGVITFTRSDTGDIVEKRPATFAELQGEFDFPDLD